MKAFDKAWNESFWNVLRTFNVHKRPRDTVRWLQKVSSEQQAVPPGRCALKWSSVASDGQYLPRENHSSYNTGPSHLPVDRR